MSKCPLSVSAKCRLPCSTRLTIALVAQSKSVNGFLVGADSCGNVKVWFCPLLSIQLRTTIRFFLVWCFDFHFSPLRCSKHFLVKVTVGLISIMSCSVSFEIRNFHVPICLASATVMLWLNSRRGLPLEFSA